MREGGSQEEDLEQRHSRPINESSEEVKVNRDINDSSSILFDERNHSPKDRVDRMFEKPKQKNPLALLIQRFILFSAGDTSATNEIFHSLKSKETS